ncbi:MAG: hypothetical protein MAG451_02396 [Anaerolineales bacterium]|nr:hypothetical protein [Anaerolineales bacterium]
MRYLLDKNLIRFAIAGLYHGSQRPLRPVELGALSFWRKVEQREESLYIADVSHKILLQLPSYDEVAIFLDSAEVLFPTRYHRRWARRIRESTGLAREDAAMIALASFGTDEEGKMLGAQALVTYDQSLINGFSVNHDVLQRRFHAMTAQLSDPFRRAALPRVVSPDRLLAEWSEEIEQ